MTQPSLFKPLILKTAGELIDLLNDGKKPKERYEPQYCFQHGKYTVFVVANKEKDTLFNVIDEMGEIPEGFCVNWRVFQHIKQELGL